MSLLDKKISELTAADIQSLERAIGTPGLPYPMAMNVRLDKDEKNEKGEITAKASDMVQKLGVIDTLKKSMVLYTEMPLEKVQGKLFREMPIPSMLLMLRDLVAKQSPTSINRIFTVFGDPAFGKSYLFKSVAGIVHPQGAIHVDCGGMNMREIFFRTVIDYGAGVREVLNKRMEDGKISAESVKTLREGLGEALVEKNGKMCIDWDKVGMLRESDKDSEAPRRAAAERAVTALKHVYEIEGITQQNNSFGIKTVPGEFFEALWSGRPLFLDEFNKSKRGTLDCWQTALQVLNGEEQATRVYNPMAQAGADDLKFLEVNRADFKLGFVVGVAGNEGKDGDTTQELSESMMTRLNPMYVGNPTIRDWEHRISQIWTGLPLVTLHSIFQDFAANKPDEFTKFLLDLREMGLNAKEVAAIPDKERYYLKNWPETVAAIRQVAAEKDFRFRLSNTSSDLFNQDAYKDLSDEINSDGRAKQIRVSFRKVIADHNKAIESTPEVVLPGKNIAPNIAEAFKAAQSSTGESRDPGWYRFGENLSRAIIEDIMNVTKDMPKTRSALVNNCIKLGIIPASFTEAKPSGKFKPLPELMKYDKLKDMGGTDELRAVQTVIMTALRSRYPAMKSGDDQVVPLENLGRVLQSFKEKVTAVVAKKEIVALNDDLNSVKSQPLVTAEAVANYNLLPGKASKGVVDMDFHAVLASLALPEYADKNREKLWLDDLLDMLKRTGGDLPSSEEEKEIYNTLTGKSKNGFHLAIASAVNSEQKPVYLYILEDRKRLQTMIVGPEPVSVQLRSSLEKNGVTYLVKKDSDTGKRIDEFLTEGTRDRHQKGGLQKGSSNEVTQNLIHAFGRVCELPPQHIRYNKGSSEPMIKEGTTLGNLIVDAADAPGVYTRFVKTPKSGM